MWLRRRRAMKRGDTIPLRRATGIRTTILVSADLFKRRSCARVFHVHRGGDLLEVFS
jgi:hypothetical protein